MDIYMKFQFFNFKKNPEKFTNNLIRKSLYFTRQVIQNKFFIPNNIFFQNLELF